MIQIHQKPNPTKTTPIKLNTKKIPTVTTYQNKIMITQFDNLLKNPKKPPALIANNRKIEGIELKRPVD